MSRVWYRWILSSFGREDSYPRLPVSSTLETLQATKNYSNLSYSPDNLAAGHLNSFKTKTQQRKAIKVTLVQSLNSLSCALYGFEHLKGESWKTCMRMLRNPPFFQITYGSIMKTREQRWRVELRGRKEDRKNTVKTLKLATIR